jgi:hypothetical protein
MVFYAYIHLICFCFRAFSNEVFFVKKNIDATLTIHVLLMCQVVIDVKHVAFADV